MKDSVREWHLPVRPPYRLDLTATVLRRLSTNVVDVFDGQTYRRMVGDAARPVLLEVVQSEPDALSVRAIGEAGAEIVPLAGRMLGAEVELMHFYRVAAEFPWLA
jgi:DNA-3-methyladenine glycosylase II